MPIPQRHEDDLADINITDAARKMLQRTAKRLKCHEHVVLDLICMLLAASLESRGVAKKRGRTSVRMGGSDLSYTTRIGYDSIRILRPYIGSLGITVSDAISDAMTHITTTSNLNRLQPLNCRNMSSFRKPMFRLEQGQPATSVKSVETVETPEIPAAA